MADILSSENKFASSPRRGGLSAWPYTLTFIPMILAIAGWQLGGLYNYMVLAFVFGLIPIVDFWIGLDDYNPTKEEEKLLEKRFSFRAITLVWPPLQIALQIYSVYTVSRWASGAFPEVALYEVIGFAFAVGIIGGMGINCSHELIHKPTWYEPLVGQICLVWVWYGHFYIEHIWGHHKRVSTPEDPASSRYNEHFYSFWFRSVKGGFLSAIHIENERLAKLEAPAFGPQNRLVPLIGASLLITYGIFTFLGTIATLFFLAQCVVAFTLLEGVNYIEHYGLERQEKPRKADGTRDYERVTPKDSHNAGHRVTNYFLFKLQRHSDHHAYAGRRYQVLRSWKSSPQLPYGYATMVLIALIPPLWFKVMNPRVDLIKEKIAQWKANNIDPFVNDPSKEE